MYELKIQTTINNYQTQIDTLQNGNSEKMKNSDVLLQNKISEYEGKI